MSIEAGVIVDSLGWALLHSLWQVALVAALIFVALRVIPRHNAQLRFVTAYAGLAASFLLFIVTWGICYRTIGAIEPVPGAIAPPAEGWQAVINTLGRTTWLISLVWGIGFSWLGVRYGQALRATARLKHEGTSPVPADWEMRFRLWIERLGADPRAIILQSSRITTPLTIGTLKPIVLVPTGFFLRLPIDQAEAVLVHEIAHICRQDYLLGLIQALICNIFFYHPAIAYLSRQIDIEREYACDARVVEETGNTNALAQGLGKVALESRDLLPGFAMAADGGSTPLMDRITRLRERPFRRENATTMPFAALTLLLVGCLTIAASADASFSSASAKDGEERGSEGDAPEIANIDAPVESGAAATSETSAVRPSSARNASGARRSAPKESRSRSGDRWATLDQQGWSFTPEPGWTFTFRGTGESESKDRSRSFEPVRFEAETGGQLRNAVLQAGIFDPDTVLTTHSEAEDEACEDKSEQIAHRRHEREAERLEARVERENARREARYAREIERAEARLEREMEREVAQFEREMERIEAQMERLGEIDGAELERELAQLAAHMTTLSAHLETRIEAHVDRARALANTARARSERSRHRHPAPSVVPEPPEAPEPVITISFNFEDGRASAASASASAEAVARAASMTTG